MTSLTYEIQQLLLPHFHNGKGLRTRDYYFSLENVMIIDSIMPTTFTISYQRFWWNGNLLLQTNQINDVHYSSFNDFLIQFNKLLCSCKKNNWTFLPCLFHTSEHYLSLSWHQQILCWTCLRMQDWSVRGNQLFSDFTNE